MAQAMDLATSPLGFGADGITARRNAPKNSRVHAEQHALAVGTLRTVPEYQGAGRVRNSGTHIVDWMCYIPDS